MSCSSWPAVDDDVISEFIANVQAGARTIWFSIFLYSHDILLSVIISDCMSFTRAIFNESNAMLTVLFRVYHFRFNTSYVVMSDTATLLAACCPSCDVTLGILTKP